MKRLNVQIRTAGTSDIDEITRLFYNTARNINYKIEKQQIGKIKNKEIINFRMTKGV